MPAHASLSFVLAGLMRRYRERVPDVGRIIEAMVARGIIAGETEIENDHIAFRTIGAPHLGIDSIERVFTHYGYLRRDDYRFEEKKLDARWFAPPAPGLPRIFVSELRVGELSDAAQRIVRRCTDQVVRDPLDGLDLDDGAAVDAYFERAPWSIPSFDDYHALAAESEYAAWTLCHGYALNHFTIGVRRLPAGYDTSAAFNAFLKTEGFRLNTAGGEVKRSPDGLLLQSSTIAAPVDVAFAGGDVHAIAGAYVEFAERRALPAFAHLAKAALGPEHVRDGFEAANADKIFESTYRAQTDARS
jgi:hypothetical protein